jgi:tetratricopeptide (TPR) repeat protein
MSRRRKEQIQAAAPAPRKEQIQVGAPAPPAADAPARRRWRRVAAWGLGGLAVVALAVVGVWYAVDVWYGAATLPAIHMPDGSDPELLAAVSRARWGIRLRPWSDQAWGHMAMLLQAHSLFDDAVTYYVQAERHNPAEPRWPYLQSAIVAGADGPQAIELLKRAAEVSGSQPEARQLCLLRLGDLCLENGRLEEAQAVYAELLKQRPDRGQAHLGLAKLAVRKGDPAAALSHLRACADSPEVRREAHQQLATVHQLRGDARAAWAAAREAEALKDVAQPDPWGDEVRSLLVGRAGALRRMAELQGQRRLDEALALEERTTVEKFPDIGYMEHGRALLRQRRWAEAEAAFRQSLQFNDKAPFVHYLLGRALFEQRRYAQAADSFKRVTELDGKYAAGYREWGRCAAARGHNAEGIRHLREALKFDPQDAQAHRDLAKLLAAEGDREGAQRHLDLAARLSTSPPGRTGPSEPQPGKVTQPRPGQ